MDFDGTIIHKDSMFEFFKFINHNKLSYYFNNLLFAPIFFFFKIGFINKKLYKNIFLKIHLKNFKKKYLENKSKKFSEHILKFMYHDAINFIENNHSEICIVSASLDIWMIDIAQLLNCQLICTESKFFNDRFDKILGNNCYGDEKVRQIKLKYNIDEYDEILVFGDSKGDYEMSKIGKYHHKFFNLKKI